MLLLLGGPWRHDLLEVASSLAKAQSSRGSRGSRVDVLNIF